MVDHLFILRSDLIHERCEHRTCCLCVGGRVRGLRRHHLGCQALAWPDTCDFLQQCVSSWLTGGGLTVMVQLFVTVPAASPEESTTCAVKLERARRARRTCDGASARIDSQAGRQAAGGD